jgi:hypothetical protein
MGRLHHLQICAPPIVRQTELDVPRSLGGGVHSVKRTAARTKGAGHRRDTRRAEDRLTA